MERSHRVVAGQSALTRLVVSLVSLAGVALGSACSCGGEVTDARVRLVAEPATVDAGGAYLGDAVERAVEVRNEGRVAATVAVEAAPPGFQVAPASFELGPGEAANLVLVFAPAEVGLAGGEVRLVGGDGEVAIAVRGEGVERQLSTDLALDFGGVRIGDRAALPLRIENRANLDLVATIEFRGGGGAFRAEADEVTVAAAGVTEVPVVFDPQVRGAAEATLLVYPCGTCVPLETRLSGTGLLEGLTVSPAALGFGPVLVGTTAERTLELRNEGDVPTTLERLEVTGGAGFAAGPLELPLELEPGGELLVPVRYAPATGGEHQATLWLGGTGSSVEVPLTGRGEEVRLVVTPASLTFGDVQVGTVAKRTVRIAAEGGLALVHGASVGKAAFSVTASRPLPAELGPALDLEVGFAPTTAGPYPDALTITTDSPLWPTIAVPIEATAVPVEPCRISAIPTELRFGLIHAGSEARLPLLLRNSGTGTCRLDDLALDSTAIFALVTPPQSPLQIPPGEEVELEVAYRPPAYRVQADHTSLQARTNDPLKPILTVPVSGACFAGDLRAIPDPLDFGEVKPGTSVVRTLEIRNVGNTAVQLTWAGVTASSPSAFGVDVNTYPRPLDPGEGLVLVVRFSPGSKGSFRGWVEVRVQNAPGPKLVRLLGSGGDDCGDECHRPVAICPGRQVGEVWREATVTGSGRDPDGDPVTCSWRISSAPTGSSAPLGTTAPCGASITPDLVGDYELELTVTDPGGLASSCLAEIRADPYSGLWVETFWSLPTDVDLHLLHPNAGSPAERNSWFDWLFACFYSNRTPSWDAPGTADDPSLDRDDDAGTGPENIRIDVPSQTHPYHVGVHWFGNPTSAPSVAVTTNVYCAGVQAATVQTTLASHQELDVLGRIDVQADGTCRFTPTTTSP